MAPEETTAMQIKTILAVVLMVAALATIAATGPGASRQAALGYGENPAGMGSGGGNLVPLW